MIKVAKLIDARNIHIIISEHIDLTSFVVLLQYIKKIINCQYKWHLKIGNAF